MIEHVQNQKPTKRNIRSKKVPLFPSNIEIIQDTLLANMNDLKVMKMPFLKTCII